jgi:hypothetical protein
MLSRGLRPALFSGDKNHITAPTSPHDVNVGVIAPDNLYFTHPPNRTSHHIPEIKPAFRKQPAFFLQLPKQAVFQGLKQ